MSSADRWDDFMERRAAEQWDAHERGEHPTPAPDCGRCERETEPEFDHPATARWNQE